MAGKLLAYTLFYIQCGGSLSIQDPNESLLSGSGSSIQSVHPQVPRDRGVQPERTAQVTNQTHTPTPAPMLTGSAAAGAPAIHFSI